MADAAKYTETRQAVWRAIEEWEPLDQLVHTQIRLEGDSTLIEPTLGHLPAVRIMPLPSDSPWILNQAVTGEYQMAIEYWAHHWNLIQGERFIEELQNAIFQSGPGAGYVCDVGIPRVLGWEAEFIKLGETTSGPNATLWTFGLAVNNQFNPSI